jgi:hypothetical protein
VLNIEKVEEIFEEESFVECCTQLQVLFDLNKKFVIERINRVDKPEEFQLLFGLQELL